MITRHEAKRLVQQHLAELERLDAQIAESRKSLSKNDRDILGLGDTDDPLALAILDDATIECEFGWAFSYQTRSFIESGDVMDTLVGNGPLFVTREGTMFETGTAEPAETYVENFKRYGTPFPTSQG